MANTNSRTNPLRLPKSREEFETQRQDKGRHELGVTGTLFANEEATVVISTEAKGWHYMDVEYAETVHKMLGEIIEHARKHNQALKK